MNKYKILVSVFLLILPFIGLTQNPIITTAGTVTASPGNVVVPITVEEFHNVAGFSLTLGIDTSVLEYDDLYNIHPALAVNSIMVTEEGQQINMAWLNFTPANIGNDTLFEIGFIGSAGNSPLIWDTITQYACMYADPSFNILPAYFMNGSVTIGSIPTFLDLKVMLEGPFNGTEMEDYLNSVGFLPLTQPYNSDPWNYLGTESVATIPSPDIIDWVLVEFRDAADAGSAGNQTMIARKAAFLLRDGSVVDLDGFSVLQLNNLTIQQSLFAIIWHRNHLGVMSALPLINAGGIFTYYFSTGAGQVFGGGSGHKELVPGVWGMISADGNADGQVNNLDKVEIWAVQAGLADYLSGDFNLDTQVNGVDKIDYWVPNVGRSSQVPY
ncbi:MAG: hypothetical protein K8R53_10995 [Bacteroidales bacterium]|nr:hypothetical protein [Bacteroidales bacterium]